MKSNWMILTLLVGGILFFTFKDKIMAETISSEEPKEDKLSPEPTTAIPRTRTYTPTPTASTPTVPTPTVPTLTSEEKILKAKIELALLPHKAHFEDAAGKLNLDINLIKAVCFRESSGNEKAYRYEAVVDDASIGLMQILLSTARGEGFSGTQDELFDPKTNIYYGSKYLKFWYEKSNGDLALTASCYNGGYKAFYHYQKNKTFYNTTYVNAVMKYYRLLKA